MTGMGRSVMALTAALLSIGLAAAGGIGEGLSPAFSLDTLGTACGSGEGVSNPFVLNVTEALVCTGESVSQPFDIDTTGIVSEGEGEGDGEPPEALTIVLQPQDVAIYAGMTYRLRIAVRGGAGPITYDWMKDGVSLGWESSPYHGLGPATLEDSGAFACRVSDGFTLLESDTATIIIVEPATHGYNSADTVQDWSISLSELLRMVQLYNAHGFHCLSGTEDGYAVGAGDRNCTPHSGDSTPQDWVIGLSELLRFIQFYNAPCGAYHVSMGTEDGFAPGAG